MTYNQSELDACWHELDRGLAATPLNLTLERDRFYSQPEWDVYRMHYTGLDGYPLFSWLSVPLRPQSGKTLALVRMPDYGSVHDIVYTPLRHDVAVMNATHRGQRHSDSAFQASYPGLLTEGIDGRETFVMLRVFADALRAVQALLAQRRAEVTGMAVTGTGPAKPASTA